jgi:hypothetical protein
VETGAYGLFVCVKDGDVSEEEAFGDWHFLREPRKVQSTCLLSYPARRLESESPSDHTAFRLAIFTSLVSLLL